VDSKEQYHSITQIIAQRKEQEEQERVNLAHERQLQENKLNNENLRRRTQLFIQKN